MADSKGGHLRLERAAHWAEIIGQGGVIVTLVILVFQVRDNTRVLESQAIMQREAPLTEHFLGESPLPSIVAKIKAVDGPDRVEGAGPCLRVLVNTNA